MGQIDPSLKSISNAYEFCHSTNHVKTKILCTFKYNSLSNLKVAVSQGAVSGATPQSLRFLAK